MTVTDEKKTFCFELFVVKIKLVDLGMRNLYLSQLERKHKLSIFFIKRTELLKEQHKIFFSRAMLQTKMSSGLFFLKLPVTIEIETNFLVSRKLVSIFSHFRRFCSSEIIQNKSKANLSIRIVLELKS